MEVTSINRIIKIGLDVYSTYFTICAIEPIIGKDDRVLASVQVQPDYKCIIMFVESLKLKLGSQDNYDIVCGYVGTKHSLVIHDVRL